MKEIILRRANMHSGNLILVNARYAYQGQATEDLVALADEGVSGKRREAAGTAHAAAASAEESACLGTRQVPILLKRRAAVLLDELLKKTGARDAIALVSGWRSFQEQQGIWDDSIAESGLEFTRKYVAVPGHSEHETGLAIDLGQNQGQIDFICPRFPYDAICGIFRKFAASHGFIERYPAGKERVTGIGHEPWHFRYVGVPHALIMDEEGLTLEEYVDFLRQYPVGRPFYYRRNGLIVSVSWLEAAEDKMAVSLPEQYPCSLSGNNVDGFIMTEWRGADGSK